MQSYIGIKIIQKIVGIFSLEDDKLMTKIAPFTFTIQWQQTKLPVLYTEK
jgi:hypothetical protein